MTCQVQYPPPTYAHRQAHSHTLTHTHHHQMSSLHQVRVGVGEGCLSGSQEGGPLRCSRTLSYRAFPRGPGSGSREQEYAGRARHCPRPRLPGWWGERPSLGGKGLGEKGEATSLLQERPGRDLDGCGCGCGIPGFRAPSLSPGAPGSWQQWQPALPSGLWARGGLVEGVPAAAGQAWQSMDLDDVIQELQPHWKPEQIRSKVAKQAPGRMEPCRAGTGTRCTSVHAFFQL